MTPRRKANQKTFIKHAAETKRVSPLQSAESDLTCTPGRDDQGGSVREDEAQRNGETRFVPPAVLLPCVCFLLGPGLRGAYRFFFRRRLAVSLAAEKSTQEFIEKH